jgi:folylpolyglutamate synthase/dihydropteroate synthase
VAAALTTASQLAGADGVVVACGSLYVAGEALGAVRGAVSLRA